MGHREVASVLCDDIFFIDSGLTETHCFLGLLNLLKAGRENNEIVLRALSE